jgi:hypothetical protein
LKNKLVSTKRARISEAIANASVQLKDRPEGSRHVVMITDGVDTPGSKVDRAEAVKQLLAARAIGAENVVTYRPKRPLAEAKPGEYRHIQVASRRVGLSLQARRGYVVPQIQN